MRGLPDDLRERYFRECDGIWQAVPALPSAVTFRRLNLCDPFAGLGHFDIIFCRNVVIYFDLPTKQRICAQFRNMLLPHGYLFLGAMENLYGINSQFEPIRFGRTVVYRPIA